MKSFLKNAVAYLSLMIIPLWIIGFFGFCLYVLSLEAVKEIKTDGLAVLTGSPERIPEGLRLFKEHPEVKVLISGMNPRVVETKLYKNIPSEAIPRLALGWTATNTYENAREVRQWVLENKMKSVTILTSFYHMPRSLLEIGNLLTETELVPAPVFPKGFYESPKWLHTRTAWLMFVEYNKTLFVLCRLGIRNIGRLLGLS